jgi:hypothetical protein
MAMGARVKSRQCILHYLFFFSLSLLFSECGRARQVNDLKGVLKVASADSKKRL